MYTACSPTKGLLSEVVGLIPADCFTISYSPFRNVCSFSNNSALASSVGVLDLSSLFYVDPTLYKSLPNGIINTLDLTTSLSFKFGALMVKSSPFVPFNGK